MNADRKEASRPSSSRRRLLFGLLAAPLFCCLLGYLGALLATARWNGQVDEQTTFHSASEAFLQRMRGPRHVFGFHVLPDAQGLNLWTYPAVDVEPFLAA